jgi:putative oxidoreductase
MKRYYRCLATPLSDRTLQRVLCVLRIGVGLLTMGHGLPKIMGGIEGWTQLGTTFMVPLGIYFWPMWWGLLGACIEFFGGIAFILGFCTRLASICLTLMMMVAAIWHMQKGHSFTIYSFPLYLIVVFGAFIYIGSGPYSLDHYLTRK